MYMKNLGKLLAVALVLAVGIGAVVLVIKLVSGAFSLIGGLLDAVLGIAVLIALAAIVIWMFRYAKKHK